MTISSGETVTVEMASHHACDDYDKMVLGDSGMENVFEWSKTKKGEEKPRRDGRRRWRARDDGPDLRDGCRAGRHPRRRDRRPDAAPEQGRQDVRLERRRVVGVPGALGPGRRHPVRRGQLHRHAGEQRRGDHDLRDHRGGRRGVRRAHVPVRLADAHRPRGHDAQLLRPAGHLHCRDYSKASPRRRRRWAGRRRRRSLVRDEPVPGQDPDQHARRLHGPRARVARLGRLDPPDADGRQPRRQADRQGFDDVLPGGGGGRSLDGRRARRPGRQLDGTAIQTSITGKFKITVHKKASFSLPWQPILDFPLGETADTWIIHGFTFTDYLAEFAANPGDICRTRTSTWRCTTRTRRRASS